MTDFARLEEKLAKLRADGAPDGVRRLRGASADELVAAIVTEIDETILPRRLSFEADTGWTIHLAVANRRLQALLSPVPDGGDLAGGTLFAAADDPEAAALLDLLRAGLDGARTLSVGISRQGGGTFGSDIGVPAPQLARAWKIEATAPGGQASDPGEALSAFLDALGEGVVAWIRIEDEAVVEEAGDEADIEALSSQAAYFLDGYLARRDSLFPAASPHRLVALAPAEPDRNGVVFIEAGAASAFVVLEAGALPATVALWRGLAPL